MKRADGNGRVWRNGKMYGAELWELKVREVQKVRSGFGEHGQNCGSGRRGFVIFCGCEVFIFCCGND